MTERDKYQSSNTEWRVCLPDRYPCVRRGRLCCTMSGLCHDRHQHFPHHTSPPPELISSFFFSWRPASNINPHLTPTQKSPSSPICAPPSCNSFFPYPIYIEYLSLSPRHPILPAPQPSTSTGCRSESIIDVTVRGQRLRRRVRFLEKVSGQTAARQNQCRLSATHLHQEVSLSLFLSRLRGMVKQVE